MAKHNFNWGKTETYYCGHQYCSGHQKVILNCSCGWNTKVSSVYNEGNEQIKTRHVLEAEGLM